MKNLISFVCVILLAMLSVGCQALGGADAGSDTLTNNWSGGMVAADSMDVHEFAVHIYAPDLSGLTPEQIAALPTGFPLVDIFVSRNETNIGTEQASRGGGDGASQTQSADPKAVGEAAGDAIGAAAGTDALGN